MGKALAMDLRERATAWLSAGESGCAVAAALDVGLFPFGEVISASARDRELCASRDGGHPPRKIVGAHETWLLQRIKTPFTLRGVVVELAECGLRVDYRTVWAFVHRSGYLFPKRPNSPRSRTAPT